MTSVSPIRPFAPSSVEGSPLLRISAVVARYLYLHRRSVSRTLEIFFWPVMELFVWGFLVLYLRGQSDSAMSRTIVFLINAMIFWDILYRSQQGVSLSFAEDIWTQNILNVLISPLRLWEWLAATFLYGLIKTALITLILTGLAIALYSFDMIGALGLYLIPLLANLLLFGWSLGIFTSALLLRWGHSVEGLIWGVPFLIQPFSAIFYPLDVLPAPVRAVSLCLPTTYVFEGMREVIRTGQMAWSNALLAFGMNLLYFALMGCFFAWMYGRARADGRLGRLGQD